MDCEPLLEIIEKYKHLFSQTDLEIINSIKNKKLKKIQKEGFIIIEKNKRLFIYSSKELELKPLEKIKIEIPFEFYGNYFVLNSILTPSKIEINNKELIWLFNNSGYILQIEKGELLLILERT